MAGPFTVIGHNDEKETFAEMYVGKEGAKEFARKHNLEMFVISLGPREERSTKKDEDHMAYERVASGKYTPFSTR
jgi:hypothetical protein